MDTVVQPNNAKIAFKGKATKERAMPWDAKSFASKHNHSLNAGEAKSAARQATAMVNAGVDDGVAIATANKRVNRLRKGGQISDKQAAKVKP